MEYMKPRGKSLSYGKIKMKSGAEICYEISPKVAVGRVSKRPSLENMIPFEDIMRIIEEVARNAYEEIKKIENDIKPNEFEITFGLGLSGDVNAYLVSAAGEGSIEVTLRWTE